jgi:hypothetical protein
MRLGSIAFVVLLATLSGCRQSPADAEFLTLVERTKQDYRSEDVRKAVLPILLVTNRGTNLTTPNMIRSMPLFIGQGNEVTIWESHDGAALAFTTGGGFGHWGIIACVSEEHLEPAKSFHGTTISWGNGIFFYKDW